MSEQKNLQKINDLLLKSKKMKRLGALKKHKDFDLIVNLTNFLPEDAPVARRLWHIENSYFEIPKCKMCDSYVPWSKEKNINYRTYCSSKCAHSDPNVIEKTKQTNIKKYGAETPMQNEEIKKTIKQKWVNTYGVDNPSKSEKIKEKKKQTLIKNWGVDSPIKSEIIKEKIKETNLKKYKSENVFSNKDIKNKIKETNKKKYGVEYPLQNEKIKEKIKETNLKKYGAEHVWCNGTSSREKHKDTMLKKYGSLNTNPLPNHILEKLNSKEWMYNEHHIHKKTLEKISKDLSVSASTVSNYMQKHNIKLISRPSSEAEREIIEYIKSIINSKILTNTRKIIPPYELDIYIPEYSLAIEYNGLYWHSELNKPKNYHLIKTKLCEEKEIRLIHIFEDEWNDQKQKCKDTLRHLLGKSEKGIYARNTTIREITWKEAKDFLEKYHLLGAGTSGNYRIGAFDKDDNLIGVMVFGIKNNEGKDKTIELKRFVTNKKNNPGLGSKMFKYAVEQKEYEKVVAFVDRRWFTGLVKDHIGFKKVGETQPALWWTDFNKRYHRRFITKEKLVKNGFSKDMSKAKILFDIGYVKIWDCGKIKLLWENNKN